MGEQNVKILLCIDQNNLVKICCLPVSRSAGVIANSWTNRRACDAQHQHKNQHQHIHHHHQHIHHHHHHDNPHHRHDHHHHYYFHLERRPNYLDHSQKKHIRINVSLCWTIGHLAWWHLVLFLSPPEDFWYFSAKIFVFSVGVTVGWELWPWDDFLWFLSFLSPTLAVMMSCCPIYFSEFDLKLDLFWRPSLGWLWQLVIWSGFRNAFEIQQNLRKIRFWHFLTAIAKLLDLRNAFAKASPDIVPLALHPRHFSCWNAQRKPVKWKLKSWLWEMKLAWLQANFHNFHEKSLKSREEARSIEGTNGMLCSDFSSQCWQRKRGKT